MRAEWTASGACSSGSTAPPRGATRRASGGAATTSTRRAERSRGRRGAAAASPGPPSSRSVEALAVSKPRRPVLPPESRHLAEAEHRHLADRPEVDVYTKAAHPRTGPHPGGTPRGLITDYTRPVAQ